MDESVSRRLHAIVAALLLAGLAGCATRQAQDERRLAVFAADYAGVYVTDGTGADGAAGVAPGAAAATEEATRLGIVRIRVPLVATHVFYVHEASAADPRRVFAQRVWSAAIAEDGRGVVLTPWELVEPGRWRDGERNPDLFKSMLPQDLRARPDCSLLWREDGKAWKGSATGACLVALPGSAQPLRQLTSAELTAEGLAIAERRLDADGRVVRERSGDPYRRYRRRGG